MTKNLRGTALRLILTLCVACLASSTSAFAQDLNGFKNPLGIPLLGRRATAGAEAKVDISVTPKTAKPGDTVTLAVKVDLPEGSYTYSMNPAFGGGTKFKFTEESGLKALGDFEADHPPKVQFEKAFEQEIEKYTRSVTWTRKYQVAEGATSARLAGTMSYQVCDATSCLPLREKFDIEVAVAGAEAESTPVPQRNPADDVTPKVSKFDYLADLRTEHAKVAIRLIPANAKPGDEVTLAIHVALAPHWHTYSLTQPEGNAAQTTEIDLDSHTGLEPIDADFVASKPFKIKEVDNGPGKNKFVQEIYEDDITWTRKFRLQADTQLADVKVAGRFRFQFCEKSCISKVVKFQLPREGAAAPETTAPVKIVPVPEAGPATSESPVPPMADLSDAECVTGGAKADIRERGVFYVLGVAFVFGLLALLTPCVFPMVPITVSFFLKQAEKKHNSPLAMALVYCFSIIATFTVMGLLFSFLFGASYINTLANGVALNLFLGLVLAFFALNLLGLFDIQVPSWLLTFTASKESTSSYFGVFFMALTFTLTSFTCTFAFLGLILVWAANGDFWWPLGGLVAFSTAFALPFFLLALFPSYLQKLPKSGGWMNRVKVVMGLIEMAFMFKFLSVADISWYGAPTLFDYHFVMSAWLAICIVTGLYLIGKITLPHDTKEDHVGVLPMVLAIGCFAMASYLAVGVFGDEAPGGFIGKQIVAFAPPRLEGGAGEDGPYLIGSHDKQTYLLDFDRAKEKAQKLQQPLFVDITGVNCINCRQMEERMAEASIQQHLKNFVRVQLYVDQIPASAVTNPKESERLLERNLQLQEEWYKDASLPSYAVVTPDGQVFLSRIQGLVPVADFETFLQCGENKWERRQVKELALSKR